MGGNFSSQSRKFFLDTFRSFRNLKTWQLFLILIPLLFITATFFRFDHLKMTKLRSEVLKADQAENDQKIAASLKKLRNFTSTHAVISVVEKNGDTRIAFGTGPFYLERQYTRHATAKLAAAEKNTDANPNGNIFAKAMAVCKPQAIQNGWQWNSPAYLDCFTSELNKYPASDQSVTTANLPSPNLYRYDFASPIWAFSLSGIFVLICVILITAIVIRSLIWLFLYLALKIIK